MALQYNPLENNFTEYRIVKTPTVNINFPLNPEPLDVSSWASKVNEDGSIVVKPHLLEMTNNSVSPSPFITDLPERIQVDKPKDLQGHIISFFKNKGMSEESARGIYGNIMVESNGNSTAVGDNGSSYGIAQWHRDRKDSLEKYAKDNHLDKADIDTQLNFLWYELNTTYKSVLEKLQKSTSVEEATTIFMKHFERPHPKYSNLTKRIQYALN